MYLVPEFGDDVAELSEGHLLGTPSKPCVDFSLKSLVHLTIPPLAQAGVAQVHVPDAVRDASPHRATHREIAHIG